MHCPYICSHALIYAQKHRGKVQTHNEELSDALQGITLYTIFIFRVTEDKGPSGAQ